MLRGFTLLRILLLLVVLIIVVWGVIKIIPGTRLGNLFATFPLSAQIATGPNSPGTNAEDSSVGTVNLSHLDYDKTSDDNYVTSQGNMDDGGVTVYLKATNFGFSIPDGATIDGISVDVERSAEDTSFFDNAIRIVKGGVVGTTDKSSSDAWPTSDDTVTYGGSSDLWGETWTNTDINSADFGFAISVKKIGGDKNKKPSIDWINITVTYTPSPSDTTAPSNPGVPQATIGTSPTLQDWSWTASTDTDSGVKNYLWWVDGGPSGTTTATTVTTNLTEGNWKFYVKAEDNAGNQSAESASVLAVLESSVHTVSVDCVTPLIQILVIDGVPNPYLDLSPITIPVEDSLVANINCEVLLKTILPSSFVTVNIPAGAAIISHGTAWPKILIPPITITPSASLLPAGSQIALSIKIGHDVTPLEITRATRILLGGQAGEKAGYITSNAFTEVTDTCADDSQSAGDALGAGKDCKIDSGSDLVIWTKHFSDFVIYTTSESQNPPSGGGGGGRRIIPPQTPVGGFGISINDGVENTESPTVVLSLKGGPDTSRMVISNFPDFKDAVQENYATTKIWNLCWENSGVQAPSACPAGTYTVYIKYYAPWGTASNVVSDAIVIKKLDQTGKDLSLAQPFTKYLRFGQSSADVKRLQIFLNQNSDTQITESGAGSPGEETNFFGYLTKVAVIKFQEKYTEDVLVPWNITKGTGFVGKTTTAKINKLLGF